MPCVVVSEPAPMQLLLVNARSVQPTLAGLDETLVADKVICSMSFPLLMLPAFAKASCTLECI